MSEQCFCLHLLLAPAQHRSFLPLPDKPLCSAIFSSSVFFPHPLQNRVPRVQVLLPLPKTALLLLQWRCFLSLGGTSWQRGTAAPCAVRVVGRVRASSTQATSRLSRQARQVLPLPLCFSTCPHPLSSLPAPKTHPVSPVSDDFGCVSLFLPSFDLQNFRAGFCASCRIVVTG